MKASTSTADLLDVETPHGLALAHVHAVPDPRGVLFLGHGAGGGVAAPDLVAATGAALAERIAVVLVEQPYRVAGRRSAAPAHQLDAAWVDVVASVCADEFAGAPLVVGGRSSGARVACRTAGELGAVGALCLAFPLQPPRREGRPPAPDRLAELEAAGVPTLVVQGENDRFGIPPDGPRRTVVRVRGDHSLRSSAAALAEAVQPWLGAVVA